MLNPIILYSPGKRRLRFSGYLLLFASITLYFIYFIDSVRFFNIRKTFYSLGGEIELVDFEEVRTSISHDNMLNASLVMENNMPYLRLEGFEKELLTRNNSEILKRGVLHPSFSLSLFSLGYASDYMTDHLNDSTFGESEFKVLEEVYLFVYKEIINPFSFNVICLGDHVISERIQFVSLFYSFTRKYYPEKNKLLRALSKDFKVCLGFLTDNEFFTWQTNHGIMQLRSLAQVAGVVSEEVLRKKLIEIFDERLSDVTPYHIGHDGAIYEAASGYWIYIIEQFTKIAEIAAVNNLQSVKVLKEELVKSGQFIRTVAANDGFLQGLGDSYSTYIDNPESGPVVPGNRYFSFSNELAGATWSAGDTHYNLLFTSLHTPLNVHKLPEDLGVYFYINTPVFSNTGTYSFDASKERLFFRTEGSQSAVSILRTYPTESISSGLNPIKFRPEQNLLILSGKKHYQDNLSVFRGVDLDPAGRISIIDSTRTGDSLITYFNIHPDIRIMRTNNHQVELQTSDSVSLSVISNSQIDIVDGLISERKEEITEIDRLKMTGNPVETTIVFPHIDSCPHLIMAANAAEKNRRFVYTKSLETKYKSRKNIENVRRLVISRFIIAILFLGLIISALEIVIPGLTRRNG